MNTAFDGALRTARFRYPLHQYRGWIVVTAVVFLPAVLWLSNAAIGPRFRYPVAALYSLAHLCALTGTAMFAVNMILGARLKLVERMVGGLDHMYRIHRALGYSVPLVLLGHALLMASTRAIGSIPAALMLFTPAAGWDVFVGVIALLGLLAALLLPRLRKLKHETFILLHRSTGIMFLLGSLHVLRVPATRALPTPLVAYLFGLISVAILAFVYRSLLGKVAVRRYRYRLEQVNRLDPSVVELVLAPLGRPMPVQPGKFAFLTIVDDQLPREAHPFSITSAPSDPQVRMVIKALGDFTARLQKVRPGGIALLEGPYGGFANASASNRRQIWIGGGIGVTPFLSMARSLRTPAHQIDFYYCTERADDAVYLDELFALSDHIPCFRVIPIRRDSLGFITAEDINAASGSLAEYEILMCGPAMMIQSLRQQFVAKGVPRSQIHFEDFAVMSV